MAQIHVLSDTETGRAPYWRQAIWAGLLGGLIFVVLEMLMVPLFLGDSPWAPIRMIAGIVLGEGVLPPPATFDFGIFVTAVIVHFVLAAVLGLVFAYLLYRLETGPALIGGAILGLLVYWINFYGFTEVFPWFAMARNWVSVFAHIVFGVSVAWIYKALAKRTIKRERYRKAA